MEVKTTLEWDGDVVKLRGKKVVNKSVYETGLIVEGQAKTLSPVDTGRLSASINTQSNKQGTGSADPITKPTKDGVVLVGTPVSYAPYMEFGTVKTDSQAFLRPALALAKGQTLTIVKKNSKSIFKEYIK